MRSRALALLFVAGSASAQPDHGGGSVVIGAEGLGFEDVPEGAPDFIGTIGLDLRGAVSPGSAPIGLAAGAGYRLGASRPGGFAYQIALLPVGVAAFADGIGWIAVMAGGDLGGVTARVPFAPRLVGEARVELALPGPFHLAAFAQPAWLAVDERNDGARDFEFADEIELGLGLRIGKPIDKWDLDSGRGLFVGGLLRQWLGATGYGVVLGYAVDVQKNAD